MSLFAQEFQLEPRKPVDVAEVFKRLAESSQYEQALMRGFGMCWAVAYAQRAGLISKSGADVCNEAVQCYLDQLADHNGGKYAPFLRDALRLAGLPWQAWHMTAIYKDWNNRPQPWEANQ